MTPFRRLMNNTGAHPFLTVNGVVIHGAKLNQLLWAILGRTLGFSESELQTGANVAEIFDQSGNPDSESAQNAQRIGFEIYEAYSANPADISIRKFFDSENILQMQDPDLYGDWLLWPSPYEAVTSPLVRPDF